MNLITGSGEDARAALNVKASLSSNLMSVALGIVGVQGGIVVFVLDKRTNLTAFYSVVILAIAALTTSIVAGGKGIRNVYKGGFAGNWQLQDGGLFNLQALFCLFGTLLVVFSSFLGSTKVDSGELGQSVERQAAQLATFSSELDSVKKQISTLQVQSENQSPASSRLKRK